MSRNAKFLDIEYASECDVCDRVGDIIKFEDFYSGAISYICIECLKKAVKELEEVNNEN